MAKKEDLRQVKVSAVPKSAGPKIMTVEDTKQMLGSSVKKNKAVKTVK